jgi:hypothetical protein
MIPELDTSDWQEAFERYSKFTRESVVRVVAHVNGANDESNWAGVFELSDGTFGYLEAGCDYTGWG